MDSNFLLKDLEQGTEMPAERIDWLEWDTDNSKNKRFGGLHNKPLAGRSLILDMKPLALDLFAPGKNETVSIAPKYAAILGEVVEIIDQAPGYIKFTTTTGTYELYSKINTNKKQKGAPVSK